MRPGRAASPRAPQPPGPAALTLRTLFRRAVAAAILAGPEPVAASDGGQRALPAPGTRTCPRHALPRAGTAAVARLRGLLGRGRGTTGAALAALLLLPACITATAPGRTPLGEVRMVPWNGQDYPLRVTRDYQAGGYWTRLVAPDAATARAALSAICDGRPYSPADWPDGRLSFDDATGEWAMRGECTALVPA